MWNTSQFAEAGVVANLSPYVMKDNFNIAQYLPVLKSWSEYKGGLWGLPKDYTPRAIYYNKKVFNNAGVAYPQPGWTWADFTDIAKKLTNGKTGAAARYGYVAIPGHTYAIQSYIWMNGGDLCSLDGKTATGYINSSQVVEVVKWYKGLFDMSISTGTMDAYQNLGQTEFQSGIVGMMDNGMWPLATFLGDKSLSFGIAAPPVPRKGVALSPVIHSATWSMFAKAKHKDAAWEPDQVPGKPGRRADTQLRGPLGPSLPIPALADEWVFNSDPNLKALHRHRKPGQEKPPRSCATRSGSRRTPSSRPPSRRSSVSECGHPEQPERRCGSAWTSSSREPSRELLSRGVPASPGFAWKETMKQIGNGIPPRNVFPATFSSHRGS